MHAGPLLADLQPDTSKPRVKGYHSEYQPPAANAVISISSAAKQVRGAAPTAQPHVYASSALVSATQACGQNEKRVLSLAGPCQGVPQPPPCLAHRRALRG